MKNLIAILVLTLLIGCETIPQSEYDELGEKYTETIEINGSLIAKLDSLQSEIDFLKKGAPKLLKEIQQLRTEKNWRELVAVYLILRENFPSTYELTEATPHYEYALEEMQWAKVKEADRIKQYEDYTEKYPEARHVQEAKNRVSEIKKEQFAQRLQNAKDRNTAQGWRSFLEEYPTYSNRTNIENKIIQLEVDEIFRDTNTGRLPKSNRTGSGGAYSSVSINNNTSYELILRYSGPSVRKVIIPAYGTSSVSLSSGNYRVAASAGGLHYGGTEYLSGSYDVKYYISSY